MFSISGGGFYPVSPLLCTPLLRTRRTIELHVDIQPHNLGLYTAWMRAQDRSKWRQLLEMAMLTDGRDPR